MKKRVVVHLWVLVFCLLAFWVCGAVTGFTVGKAHADQCSGWNGRFFQTSQCDNGYQCTGISFGPFWTNNCTDPNNGYYPPPSGQP